MAKLFKFHLLIAVFLLFSGVSSAQKKKVDLGKLQHNTYTNGFFELKIEFPFGWLLGDNKLEAQLMAIRSQAVQAKNAKAQAAVNKAVNRLTPLLGGYKALPGSVPENSNLKIVVEDLSTVPTLKTSQAYLKKVISSFSVIKLPAGFSVSGIQSETIDGKQIDYIETKYLSNHKRSYVIIKKGFAILLTIDAYNQADFDALHQILKEIDLDYKK